MQSQKEICFVYNFKKVVLLYYSQYKSGNKLPYCPSVDEYFSSMLTYIDGVYSIYDVPS